MILVDTSVWVDHFRKSDTALQLLLESARVITHPFVIGEIALGNMPQYDLVLRQLDRLPKATKASDHEVMHFIRSRKLFGTGIGFVDAHLLATAFLSSSAGLWTRDKRLHRIAEDLGVAAAL
jgi:predicted nucleic acid-binding protein